MLTLQQHLVVHTAPRSGTHHALAAPQALPRIGQDFMPCVCNVFQVFKWGLKTEAIHGHIGKCNHEYATHTLLSFDVTGSGTARTVYPV